MFAPARIVTAIKPSASAGVLGSAALVMVVFASTPFLIPAVSADFGVDLGAAGLISTVQVGGFAVTSFLAGRLATIGRLWLVGSCVVLGVATAGSAIVQPFALLLVSRGVAGAAMGVITWLAWSDATRHHRGLSDVAATGPLAATISSPIVAWLASAGGHKLVYAVLAVGAFVVLVLPADLEPSPPVGRAVSGSRSNRVLLAALTLLALSGSSLFVFAAVTGAGTGMSPLAVSLGFSLNALAGVVGTRTTARHGWVWAWFASIGVFATLVGVPVSGIAFIGAMMGWGFAYWVGVPAVFRMLADRSLRPDERLGDAQSLMAVGRVLGPALGGIVLGADRFVPLTVFSVGGTAVTAALVGGVELRRRRAARPTP
ncbi:MAG: MFS transporter [Acidimicrobiia bacterium]|nr:MFS transporter [Acidimicrobiia bacterium]